MSVKRKFTIDEIISLAENCYFVNVDDLCDLREIGFEKVRWVKDIFEEFGGCWIAEKDEKDVDGDRHGGMFAFGKPFERSSKMFVCLSVRVGRMLDEVCEKESKNENDRIRNKVEDLMYDLHDSLDKWNGNNMRNVNRIILVLEDLVTIFKRIRDKQIER